MTSIADLDENTSEEFINNFPDTFAYKKSDSTGKQKRVKECITNLIGKLNSTTQPNCTFCNFLSNLPKVQSLSKRDIRLTHSLSDDLRNEQGFAFSRHSLNQQAYIPIIPINNISIDSAFGYDYFLIHSVRERFYRDYAIYKSGMVSANVCLLSNKYLAPSMRGRGHTQIGSLVYLPFPDISQESAKQIACNGEKIYEEEQNVIKNSNPKIALEDLYNPKFANLCNAYKENDKFIDGLYGLQFQESVPEKDRKEARIKALLEIYAYKTSLKEVLEKQLKSLPSLP